MFICIKMRIFYRRWVSSYIKTCRFTPKNPPQMKNGREVANCLRTDSFVGDGHLLPVWHILTHGHFPSSHFRKRKLLPTSYLFPSHFTSFPLPNWQRGEMAHQPLRVQRIHLWIFQAMQHTGYSLHTILDLAKLLFWQKLPGIICTCNSMVKYM